MPSDGATVDATASGVMLPVPKVFAAGMQQCLVGGAQRTDLQLEATLRSQVELEKRLAPLDEGAFRRAAVRIALPPRLTDTASDSTLSLAVSPTAQLCSKSSRVVSGCRR